MWGGDAPLLNWRPQSLEKVILWLNELKYSQSKIFQIVKQIIFVLLLSAILSLSFFFTLPQFYTQSSIASFILSLFNLFFLHFFPALSILKASSAIDLFDHVRVSILQNSLLVLAVLVWTHAETVLYVPAQRAQFLIKNLTYIGPSLYSQV